MRPMHYRSLGRIGISIPALRFGASRLGNAPGVTNDGGGRVRPAHRAIDLGVSCFDTLPCHGQGLPENRQGKGMEQLHHNFLPKHLQPDLDTNLDVFSTARLLFGSHCPVCLAAGRYARSRETVHHCGAPLSACERARIFREAVREVYSL